MGSCISSENKSKSKSKSKSKNKSTEEYDLIEQLNKIDPKSISNVFYQDCPIMAKVIDVYDGDTIKVIILIDKTPIKISLRLNGIDTPEIKKGKGKLEEEKEAGIICRDKLKELVENKIVTIVIRRWDKYARVVADVYWNYLNINQYMIKHNLAKPYLGDTKTNWTIEELNKILSK